MSDPHLWLEEVTSETALDWVRERGARAVAEFADAPEFAELESRILEVLDTDARIPYVSMRGEWLYNFWRDAEHPRGLWRRTTLASYRTEAPEWDVVLDVDALAAAEDENWVWAGASVLRPDQSRALLSLSRGGADAAVVREFDMATREFVTGADAFELDEAKSGIEWIDRDSVYVETDFGPGSLTDSGYPRVSKLWRRGTPLADAETVFEGERTDVSVGTGYDDTEGFERTFVSRSLDFYRSERFEKLPDGEFVRIDVPEDAGMGVHRQWLTIRPRTDWEIGGATYPAGSLLAADYDAWTAGDRTLIPLFTPDPHTSLDQAVWLRDHLILVTLTDVRTAMHVLTPAAAGEPWTSQPVDGIPELTSSSVVAADSRSGNAFFVNASGFTTPSTLLYGEPGAPLEAVKRAPGFFDTTDTSVEQFFATSDDGTAIPYFVVRRTALPPNAPTLLYGYGGFENSLVPGYSGTIGRGWIERGGVYVVANIRGGGEYGPAWHTQAIREGRHLAYEDFAAVARDLVARGITTPRNLGVQGGSNGGLLTGVMLTRYPELFGAIVCSVPLLDMSRYHRLLAGASWMAEYGDPDDPEDWAFLREYSPYHNTDPDRTYPPVLFTSSTRDDRVHPGHARKMVALLEEQGRESVWYYENIEGGHGGAADNKQSAFKAALTYTFLWETLT
ncbi:S9 family peptidase [Rhodococcus rhodnii]|nr:prolyl oligopeptidase family serine peptidase [Rhodococcus rhodnii]TXG92026.1 S9 family peptidase [Rhodococcus rhodnii]